MGETVLVVEDDPDIRAVLRLALEAEGYRVASAPDGPEALAQVDREPPALILLDLLLPRMDGRTFARALERRGRRPGLPIVVLSAAARAEQAAAELGAEGFLPKPFNLDELLAVVEGVVRRAPSEARPPDPHEAGIPPCPAAADVPGGVRPLLSSFAPAASHTGRTMRQR